MYRPTKFGDFIASRSDAIEALFQSARDAASQVQKPELIRGLRGFAGIFKTDLNRCGVEVDARGILFELVVLSQENLLQTILRSFCCFTLRLLGLHAQAGRFRRQDKLCLMLGLGLDG